MTFLLKTLAYSFENKRLVLPIALLLGFVLLAIAPSYDFLLRPSLAATTFVVNSTADTADFSAGDGVCDTDDGVGDGPCTLRAAIQEANALAGADTIEFNIAGAGPHLITKASDYPAITESVLIDGTTQAGASCSSMDLMVGIAGAAGTSLIVNGPDVVIRGLYITQDTTGIALNNLSADATIECNLIGLNQAGSALATITRAIDVNGGSGHIIGGGSNTTRNILAGTNSSLGYAIRLTGGSNITIKSNNLNSDKSGITALATSGYSVHSTNVTNLTVGGVNNTDTTNACQGDCNLMSGLLYIATGNTGVAIQGNYVGANASGAAAFGGGSGLLVASTNVLVGGYTGSDPNPAAMNLISGGRGIYWTNTANGLTVVGNYIGTDRTGTSSLPNSQGGLRYGVCGMNGCAISGIIVEYNLISGNTGTGGISFDSSTSGIVRHNVIGLNATQTAFLPNAWGVLVIGSSNTIEDNVIAGNTIDGISIRHSSNLVANNTIYSNGGNGIECINLCAGNSFQENEIYDNTIGIDLRIGSNAFLNNSILRNSIHDNDTLGIDIGANGITANDPLDSDVGANDLQNFPEITSVEITTPDTTTEIDYTFDSTAASFTVDFFYSTSADPSGNGEGATYFCTDIIAHPGGGSANYSESCATEVPPGSFITAVATRGTGPAIANYFSSSEFSPAVEVVWWATDGLADVSVSTPVEMAISLAVDDLDLNTNNSVVESVTVLLSNDTTGETEDIILTENSINSSVFSAQVPTLYGPSGAGTNNDGSLSGVAGHLYSIEYLDEYDSAGNSVVRTGNGVFTNGIFNANQDSATVYTATYTAIHVLLNDYDPEDAIDSNFLVILAQPTYGNVYLRQTSDSLIYVSDLGFIGNDVFSYFVCDEAGSCDSASVVITVIARPVSPASTTPTPTPSDTPAVTPTFFVATTLRPSPTQPVISILPETGGEAGVSTWQTTLGQLFFSFFTLLPMITVIVLAGHLFPGFTLYAFSWLKRQPRVAPWGIVYDRSNLHPVAFATVQLLQNENLLEERVTDMDGKYGFVNDQGSYEIRVKHSSYEAYSSGFVLGRKEGIIARDIALTALASENVSRKLRLRKFFFIANVVLFAFGLLLSVTAAATSFNGYNLFVLITYLVQICVSLLLKIKRSLRRDWGYVVDSADNSRIRGVFIRIFDQAENNQLEVQMTDEAGRFGFILKPGEYMLTADAAGYKLPSAKLPHDFQPGAGGGMFAQVHVGQNQSLNIVVTADKLSAADPADLQMPSPFA